MKNLPPPLGEVAEQSEVGEGQNGNVSLLALSVAFGDSSPRGRAKL